MYNFALAFVICAAAFMIGEFASNLTKAWIPSVFVTAVLLLFGYWLGIPTSLVSDSNLIPFGSSVAMYLIVAHMGTVISFRQLAEQWKTIIVCLSGLVGMGILTFAICPMLMDRSLVIAGIPPLTGGLVAATIMSDAAKSAGLAEAAVFAIAMYCVQGFAGYPLTSLCLQLEGKRLLNEFRSCGQPFAAANSEVDAVNGNLVTQAAAKKKLLPPVPEHWNSEVVILGKLGLVCWLATMLARVQFPVIGGISGAVWALVLGVVFTAIGFLDENSLIKARSYGIIMFALMMYIFDGLKDCTPEMLSSILGPMITLIVIGIIGMAVVVFLAAKLLNLSFPMAMAAALTALYGFPPNAIITESTCKALAAGNKDAEDFLMSRMFAPMIVGGFTTVTITSVVIAGIFAQFL